MTVWPRAAGRHKDRSMKPEAPRSIPRPPRIRVRERDHEAPLMTVSFAPDRRSGSARIAQVQAGHQSAGGVDASTSQSA